MSVRKPVRLAVTLALVFGSTGASVALVAGPAQATGIGCSYSRGINSVPGVSVTGYEYYVCQTSTTAMPVTLTRNGITVATGTGTATESCAGTQKGSYEVDGTGVGTAECTLNLN